EFRRVLFRSAGPGREPAGAASTSRQAGGWEGRGAGGIATGAGAAAAGAAGAGAGAWALARPKAKVATAARAASMPGERNFMETGTPAATGSRPGGREGRKDGL